MNLQDVLNHVEQKLEVIENTKISNLGKYKLCRDLIVECHTLIDFELLSEASINEFVTPVRCYVFDMAGGSLTRVKDWQKANRGDIKNYFSEKIEKIDNVTGYRSNNDFIYFAFNAITLTTEQWNKLKTEKIIAKQHDSLNFDLDDYLQVTENLLLSDNVYERLSGLVASLGRRPTELFNSKSFELVDGKTHTLLFHGQLKTKKDIPQSFEIGTLFEADYLFDIWQNILDDDDINQKLETINDLFGDDDDIKKHELIDDRFNAILNRIIKEKYQFIPIPIALQNDQNGVTCRVLRRCYATIIVSRDCNIGDVRKCLDYYSELLGHGNNTATTIGYLDYSLFNNSNMFFELEVPNATKNISLENNKKLMALLAESGGDINDLIESMINIYQQNKPKEIVFSNKSWKDLKPSNAPYSGNEKVTRAFNAIVNHNNDQGEKELKYCITARVLMELSGSRHSIVKAFIESNQTIIDAHNEKHGLVPVHNRGKDPVIEVIHIS
jgi:hypothetical protein